MKEHPGTVEKYQQSEKKSPLSKTLLCFFGKCSFSRKHLNRTQVLQTSGVLVLSEELVQAVCWGAPGGMQSWLNCSRLTSLNTTERHNRTSTSFSVLVLRKTSETESRENKGEGGRRGGSSLMGGDETGERTSLQCILGLFEQKGKASPAAFAWQFFAK